jgi:hypothetical protein
MRNQKDDDTANTFSAEPGHLRHSRSLEISTLNPVWPLAFLTEHYADGCLLLSFIPQGVHTCITLPVNCIECLKASWPLPPPIGELGRIGQLTRTDLHLW